MVKKRVRVAGGVLFLFFVCGCGYTTHSMLSPDFRSIYVNNFQNKIKITAEQSDVRMYRGYRPGMETDLTKGVIDKFLSDGNLKIVDKDSASLVLSGDLMDLRKEPLRYDDNNTVEEYRIIITVDMELNDARNGKLVWREAAFSGEATYRTSGSLAKSESSAIDDAVADLARRIVERTVEGW